MHRLTVVIYVFLIAMPDDRYQQKYFRTVAFLWAKNFLRLDIWNAIKKMTHPRRGRKRRGSNKKHGNVDFLQEMLKIQAFGGGELSAFQPM